MFAARNIGWTGSTKSATARKRLNRFRCCLFPGVPRWRPCHLTKKSCVYRLATIHERYRQTTDRPVAIPTLWLTSHESAKMWGQPLEGLRKLSVQKIFSTSGFVADHQPHGVPMSGHVGSVIIGQAWSTRSQQLLGWQEQPFEGLRQLSVQKIFLLPVSWPTI